MLGETIRNRGTESADKGRVFIRFEDLKVTSEEFYRASIRYARLFLAMKQTGPFHVGVLMENYPEFLYAFGGCALSGAVLVGMNYTQLGEQLARNINHMDCQFLLTEPKYVPAVRDVLKDLQLIKEGRILVNTFHEEDELPSGFISIKGKLEGVRRAAPAEFEADPNFNILPTDPLMVIFTSGTTGAPKGIMNSHAKFLGAGILINSRLCLTPEDIAYFSMPLFHSNSTFLSLMPALISGAGIAFRRRFSSHHWLDDVRSFGATAYSYVGKTMSYLLEIPPTPQDRDNSLRLAIGNGASGNVRVRFRERYGVERVIEMYGATEAGATILSEPDDPLESVGACPEYIRILNAEGKECPPAEFDEQGRMLNAEHAVGEIVRITDIGLFESYYKNPEATNRKTRDGMFWTGDLGHVEVRQKNGETERFLFFDGRTDDWIRYNGENFPAEPIEKFAELYGPARIAAVYGIPCERGDDDVMCALILKDGQVFDPSEFHRLLENEKDMPELWMPRYVRILQNPPITETNKVIKRVLQKEQVNIHKISDLLYFRDKQSATYVPFTMEHYCALVEQFRAQGRERFLNES
jgi:fatty-acyl-CoA synthase